jgi:hypothetical protein
MAAVANDKIIVNFGWKGPSSWHGGALQGGLDIGVVQLFSPLITSGVSISIPDGISPEVHRCLPFTVRKYSVLPNGHNMLSSESQPQSLILKIDQVKNLTLKAGVFEKSPHSGPSVMDSSGKVTQELRLLRSDRDVPLVLPSNFEIGATYCLQVTSGAGLTIKAALVKEEAQKADDEKAVNPKTLDQLELHKLLEGVLVPLMILKQCEYGMKAMMTGKPADLQKISERNEAIAALKEAINKINTETLKELMVKVRALRSSWDKKPASEQKALEKECFKLCFTALGDKGLENLMSSCLKKVFPDGDATIIEGLATRFSEICQNQVK